MEVNCVEIDVCEEAYIYTSMLKLYNVENFIRPVNWKVRKGLANHLELDKTLKRKT